MRRPNRSPKNPKSNAPNGRNIRVSMLANATSGTVFPNSCATAEKTNVSRKKSSASSAQPRKQAMKVFRWSRVNALKSRIASISESNFSREKLGSFDSFLKPALSCRRSGKRGIDLRPLDKRPIGECRGRAVKCGPLLVDHVAMRYLVKARVKPGREESAPPRDRSANARQRLSRAMNISTK